MIISLRGTSGSGKSRIVHDIIRWYGAEVVLVSYPPEEGAKQRPMGYLCGELGGRRRLFVPGHYEISNGGVDTLPTIGYAYDLIRKHHELGFDVLYEGKNMSDGWGRIVELKKDGIPVRAVLLTTSLGDCVRSVRERGHAISETSIRKTHEKCLRDADQMRARGVSCFRLSREQALAEVKRWLT